MSTRPFTVDPDVIRRLALRRDHDEREHERSRPGYLSFRFLRGLSAHAQGTEWALPRSRF